jgi:phosphomannomutase
MKWTTPQPKSELEKIFFNGIEKDTPKWIMDNPIIDINNEGEITFTISRDNLLRNVSNPLPYELNETRSEYGYDLYDWLKSFKAQAKISTGGIRGPQNPLYPWDYRYPLNLIGFILVTASKAIYAKRKYPDTSIYKIAGNEVRYNSPLYAEIIARLQAGFGINTLVTDNYKVIPIWLTSFLIFKLDLYGGEYITSSHAISKKTATKDLNFEGSQFVPEELLEFVTILEEIFKEVQEKGTYKFSIAPVNDKHINRTTLLAKNYCYSLYVDYLKNCVATDYNLDLIKSSKFPILIDCMGGSMYPTMDSVLTILGIRDKFEFLHKETDPFFHGIGKIIKEGNKFYDYGCDTTIIEIDHQTNFKKLPVVNTMNYEQLLKDKPIGTVCLMTDPDGDRLVTTEIISIKRTEEVKELDLPYITIDDSKILVEYMPNQSFIMTFDFQYQLLQKAGLINKYNWFIIKTTPSSMTWDIWGEKHNIPVINTPVGFKEIQGILQKIETQMKTANGNDIIIKDIYGNNINIGKNPRLLFAGEESGGEIFGPAKPLESLHGRQALSMREKSACEAILITSAMQAELLNKQTSLLDYLVSIYKTNNILAKYELRVDTRYYDENESNIQALNESKLKGMVIKNSNDMYFLSLALALKENIIDITQAKEILSEVFNALDFTDLLNIYFVGDGTYFKFKQMFLEVRPSGTDAINKAYSASPSKEKSLIYPKVLSEYNGTRNPKHKQFIPEDFYANVKETAYTLLNNYQKDGIGEKKYIPPVDFSYLD